MFKKFIIGFLFMLVAVVLICTMFGGVPCLFAETNTAPELGFSKNELTTKNHMHHDVEHPWQGEYTDLITDDRTHERFLIVIHNDRVEKVMYLGVIPAPANIER